MEHESDHVNRALAGDHEAFARLVRPHLAVARRVAWTIVGNGDEADDAVQDAIVKCHSKLAAFDTRRAFRPWLLTIVANEARNRRRANGRRARAEQRAGAVAEREALPVRDDPEWSAEQEEQRRALAQAVVALDMKDREVIALRYFAELSEAETAAVLGCKQGTVKSRLSRALERLRAQLAAEAMP